MCKKAFVVHSPMRLFFIVCCVHAVKFDSGFYHFFWSWFYQPRLTLRSVRQHPRGDCLEVKREYHQNCSVLDCVTQCSQSAAHLYEQFLQVQRIGLVILGPLRCV